MWCVAVGLSCAAWRVLTASGRIARPQATPRHALPAGRRHGVAGRGRGRELPHAERPRGRHRAAGGHGRAQAARGTLAPRRRHRGGRRVVPAARRGARRPGAVARAVLSTADVRRVRGVRAHRASRRRADAARRAAPRGARAGHVDSAGASPASCSSRASPDSSGHCSTAARRPPGFRTKCRRAASASSPPNTTRPFACASRARRRGAPRCTGAARCSTASMDSPGGANRRASTAATPLDMLGEPLRYRITLEPTNQRWMFALDTVDASPRPRRGPVARPAAHRHRIPSPASSATTPCHTCRRAPSGRCRISAADYETRLPEDRNPRTLALAHEMRARAGSDAEYARAVLDWFRDNGLEYTLEPGVTSIDSVDTTLFDTKRGFCGHFASAYATMMRAAGVPARIVTGYLGGEWNPVGGYFIVRQSEAHAWTEVWLDGQGWTRIDPTAVVAPERLERGVFDLMADSLPATSPSCTTIAWLNRIDAVVGRPQPVVAGQCGRIQSARAARLAQPARDRISAMGTPGLGIRARHDAVDCLGGASPCVAVSRASSPIASRAPGCAPRASWQRVAPARCAHEGPLDFAQRIAAARPDLAAQVAALAARYCRLRFGPARSRRRHWRELRTRSQAAGGVSRTRHSNTPPITNSSTSDTIDARCCASAAATTRHEQRPEQRRELAHHVVEAEELRVLAFGHQPAEQRTRQALHAALHEADGNRPARRTRPRCRGSRRTR